MGLPRENRLVERACELRKNQTEAERRLWYNFLREYTVPFRQQKIIGRYIVDFFCNKARVSIELDGSQHLEKYHLQYDETRTLYLEMLEVRELRFYNSDIWENFEGVCEVIHRTVNERRNDLSSLSLEELKKKS